MFHARICLENEGNCNYAADQLLRIAFSKLKALLRATAERTIAALWATVGSVLDLFTPAECANYFKAAGYDPD